MSTRDVIPDPKGTPLPGELRPHQGQLPGPGDTPSTPSAAATTPGLALAAAHVPGGPTLPDLDPVALTNLIGRMANDLFSAPAVLPMSEPVTNVTPATPALPGGPSLPSVPGTAPTVSAPSPGALATPLASPALPLSPFAVAPTFDGLFGSADAVSAMTAAEEWSFPLVDVPSEGQPAAPLPMASTPSWPSAYEITPTTDVSLPRASSGPLDPLAVKREFPILNERIHGRPLVWLDNAATTQKPRAVIDRLSYFYEHENSNVHRAAHTLAERATDAYEGARESVRRFLHAKSTRDVVFVRGTTEGINLVAQSWGRRHVGEGDEIVITWLEHHANIVPWQMLAREKGARLRVAPVDDRGAVILEEYEKLLGPKTRIVAFTQVSNALGTVTPAKEMVDIAHRYGAKVLVDGAQSVAHMRVDVEALGSDFFVFSGHKIFAPTGIGAVLAPSELLDTMPPWQGGGNMIQDVTFERTLYQPAPARFEAGTGNIADAAGLGAALDWLERVGIDRVERYEHGLYEYAAAELSKVPGLTLIGTAPERAGVLSFVLAGQKTESISEILDQEGIAVRSGHHCAQPILRRFGLEATVRASLAPYNTCEDIDALVAALRRLPSGHATTWSTP
jgi:cysteine desulfurase / selenocysteine lyase